MHRGHKILWKGAVCRVTVGYGVFTRHFNICFMRLVKIYFLYWKALLINFIFNRSNNVRRLIWLNKQLEIIENKIRELVKK